MRMRRAITAAFSAAVVAAVLTAAHAARPWPHPEQPWTLQPQPNMTAGDYVHVMDRRSRDELVSVQWIVAKALSNPSWLGVADRYIIVGVTHVRLEASAETAPDAPPEVSDAAGHILKRFTDANLPPPAAKMFANRITLIRNAKLPERLVSGDPHENQIMLGYVGQFQFYAFEKQGVEECSPGGLVIHYAGERYTFDTPLPGCPAPR